MKNRTPIHWRKVVASLLSLNLALGPIATPAYGAVTKLADEPIAFTPSAEPSVVLTVDDSTSMLSDFLPDYIIGAVPGASPGVGGFCRDSSGLMSVPCGFGGSGTSPPFIYSSGQTLGAPNIPYPRYGDGNPPNAFNYSNSTIPDWLRAWPAPVHSNALNRIYYDPSIEYRPPVKFDGTPYPDQTTYTSVVADPWSTELRYENLTSNVQVGMWCNSDWPNDTNWNPGTGGGAECRINGTDYSAVAPATPGDYQYPWNKQSGVNDAKYYWRGASGVNTTWNKSLWCDTTHAKYPKNCTTTNVCPVAVVLPPTQPQTCFFQSNQTGCLPGTTVTTYTPAGCNTNPAYSSPGPCVGPECLPCSSSSTCTNGVTGKNGRCRLSSSAAPGSGGSNAACNCSGAGCSLPACPAYQPPGTCPVALVPQTTCSNITGGCTQRLHDPVTKTNIGITMQQDADGAGEVCRRNNRAYPSGPAAGPFNYPSGLFTAQRTGSCPTVPGFATVPRHYWKTSVEWCAAKITTSNNKWRGFGAPGSCQDEHDAAHPYPRFYKWGVPKTDPAYLDNYANPAFERVDLSSTTPNYTHTYWKNGVWQTVTRTYAQEMTNYANWFAYYRTRIQAAKTVISQNFTFLDTDFMVGFHTLSNTPGTSYVDPKLFDVLVGGQKDKWYQQLFGIQIKMGQQTPNIDAVVRIGELYKGGGNPSLSGSSDPIKLSCQKNYHMLFTDGITNQTALPSTTVGNLDDIVPPLPQPLVVAPPIVAGSPWPNLYRENTAASMGNTLADYTTHYWVTDMRPAMTNNVLIGKDPGAVAALELRRAVARYRRRADGRLAGCGRGADRRRHGEVADALAQLLEAGIERRRRPVARRRQRARPLRQRQDVAAAGPRHRGDPLRHHEPRGLERRCDLRQPQPLAQQRLHVHHQVRAGLGRQHPEDPHRSDVGRPARGHLGRGGAAHRADHAERPGPDALVHRAPHRHDERGRRSRAVRAHEPRRHAGIHARRRRHLAGSRRRVPARPARQRG